MKTLNHCLLSNKIEPVYVTRMRAASDAYFQKNKDRLAADMKAAEDLMTELEDERASIIQQIKDAGGEVPELKLEAQTEEDLAELESKKQAEAKKEAKAKKDAENKAKADTEAKDFRLTGSDRSADVAMAGGQNDLFGAKLDLSQNIFYSQMQDVLEKKLNGKGSGESFAKQIEALSKNGQFKTEELEWSGLLEWLRSKDNVLRTVTKAEVLDYLRANEVQIQDVMKGGDGVNRVDNTSEIDRLNVELTAKGYDIDFTHDDMLNGVNRRSDGEFFYYEDGEWQHNTDGEPENLPEDVGDLALQIADLKLEEMEFQVDATGDGTRYSEYTLPGGKDYRELLLTLPENKPTADVAAISAAEDAVSNFLRERNFVTPIDAEGRAEYERLVSEVDKARDATSNRNRDPNFRSNHFDEPNILAHVRFNERTDADGKRVLFIEEVQSDWHQAGRRVGYSKGGKIEKVSVQEREDGSWEAFDQNRNLIAELGTEDIISREEATRQATEMVGQPIVGGAPDAPFKKSWPMLAMKRMIRYAAENGFERIAWTTGEQQAERYWGNELVAPAVLRWKEATEPESVGKLAKDVLGGKMAAAMPLKIVDAGVLAVLKHDQVRRDVVSRIPVNVVDILAEHGFRPEQLVSQGDVVLDRLSSDARDRALSGLASALRDTGATLRAKLEGLKSGGNDLNLLPALKASGLKAREVAGVVSPGTVFDFGGLGGPEGATATGAAAETLTSQVRGPLVRQLGSAKLAELLNAHAAIMGNDGLVRQGVQPPPGEGMRAFYDRELVNEVNKYVKKWGAKVGESTFFQPISQLGDDFDAHSIDVTPKMQAAAVQPQPLFNLKPDPKNPIDRRIQRAERGLRSHNNINMSLRRADLKKHPESKMLRGMAKAAKTLFGREVIFFEAEGKAVPNGFVMNNEPNTIYINASTWRNIRGVIGHELLHTLRKQDPDAYNAILDVIRDMSIGLAHYSRVIEKIYRDAGAKPLSKDAMTEEFVADFLGTLFTEPGFPAQFAASMSKSKFKKLAAKLIEILDKLISRVKRWQSTLHKDAGNRTFVNHYMADLEATKQAILEAVEGKPKPREEPAIGEMSPAMKINAAEEESAPAENRLSLDPNPEATGIKNEESAKTRARHNLIELQKAAAESWGQTWEMSRPDDSTDPWKRHEILFAKLQAKARQLTELEQAMLLRLQIKAENRIREIDDEIIDLHHNGSQADIAPLNLERNGHEQRVDELTRIFKESGTLQGRAFNARKIMARFDMTLVRLKQRLRSSKNGGRLTPEEEEELQRISDEYYEAEKQENDAQDKAGRDQAFDDAHDQMQKDWVGQDPNIPANQPKAKKKRGKDIRDKIKDAVANGAKPEDLGNLIQRLARVFVELGQRNRDGLIDDVRGELQRLGVKMSRRDVMDAISGYGQFSPLSKDVISVELRRMKGELQQVGKIEDILSGNPPKKTGVERREPSDEERRLIREVNDLKKQYNIQPLDPAKALKSALDTIKTRLRNQISDLENAIDKKERINRSKTPSPSDKEVEDLTAIRDMLKQQYDSIFPRQPKPMTPQQRLKLAEKALEASIEAYEKKIADGDTGPFKKSTTVPLSSPKLDALKARRDALKEELKALRDAKNPKKTPEERAAQALKTRLANQIADLQRRIEERDFSKKAKRPPISNPEINAARAKRDALKRRFHEMEMKNRIANWDTSQKIWSGMKEIIGFPRAMQTMLDFSAVLRQGAFIVAGHPIRSAKQIPNMWKATFSEEERNRQTQEIYSRPNAVSGLYQRAGLYIAEHGPNLSQREEVYINKWIEKVPILKHAYKGSERAYTSFLNHLRADAFDALVSTMVADGKNPTDEEARALAYFVNNATGRGSAFGMQQNAEAMSALFYSPRYLTSRFVMLAGAPLWATDKGSLGRVRRNSAATRKLIALEYGRYLLGMATVLGLHAAAQAAFGDEDEEWFGTDPRSTDFGKIILGNTRIDWWAGFQQVGVLAARIATRTKVTQSGKEVDIWGEGSSYGNDGGAVFWQFLTSKLSPPAGLALGFGATGKDFKGDPLVTGDPIADANKAFVNNMAPFSLQTIYEVMGEHGIAHGAALSALAVLGVGISVHKDE